MGGKHLGIRRESDGARRNLSFREEEIGRGDNERRKHQRNPATFQLSCFGRATLLAAPCSNRCFPARKEPGRPGLLVQTPRAASNQAEDRIETLAAYELAKTAETRKLGPGEAR